MAERYVIEIRNNTEDEVSRQTTAPTPDGSGTGAGQSQSKPDEEKQFKFKKATAVAAFAVSVADRVIGTQINTIALRTGYEEKQQKAQFAYSAAKRSAGIVTAIAAGVATGNLGVAVFGTALYIANDVLSYSQRQQEIEYARASEGNSIMLNQIRMGAGSNREGKTR